MELCESLGRAIFGVMILPDLAREAGVGIVTVHQLEAGSSQPRRATMEVIRSALERAGVEFIDENGGGPGVRLKKRQRSKKA
jgi:transcriptional regulator with XRE-family HTH domain